MLDRKLRIVQQHLADLKREELVVQARDGWCRSAANPDDVETRLNVAAVQREQKRQQQYQQERIDDARSRGSVRRRS